MPRLVSIGLPCRQHDGYDARGACSGITTPKCDVASVGMRMGRDAAACHDPFNKRGKPAFSVADGCSGLCESARLIPHMFRTTSQRVLRSPPIRIMDKTDKTPALAGSAVRMAQVALSSYRNRPDCCVPCSCGRQWELQRIPAFHVWICRTTEGAASAHLVAASGRLEGHVLGPYRPRPPPVLAKRRPCGAVRHPPGWTVW